MTSLLCLLPKARATACTFSGGTGWYGPIPWIANGNSTPPYHFLTPVDCLNTADVKAPDEVAGTPSASQEAITRLHAIIDTIRTARPLAPPSPELDGMLTRAIQERGVPSDIEAWANQLAQDTGDLGD